MAIEVVHSQVTVVDAGTAVALAASAIRTPSVTIVAKSDNTGNVYIGNSGVVAASELGLPLAPGDALTIDGPQKNGIVEEIELENLYVDAATGGDGNIVTVIYLSRTD